MTELTLMSQQGEVDFTSLSIKAQKVTEDKKIVNTLDFKKSPKISMNGISNPQSPTNININSIE